MLHSKFRIPNYWVPIPTLLTPPHYNAKPSLHDMTNSHEKYTDYFMLNSISNVHLFVKSISHNWTANKFNHIILNNIYLFRCSWKRATWLEPENLSPFHWVFFQSPLAPENLLPFTVLRNVLVRARRVMYYTKNIPVRNHT